MEIYHSILKSKNDSRRRFGVLIDPDKPSETEVAQVARIAREQSVDFIFVGGSLITNGNLEKCIRIVRDQCEIPVILFPGNTMQITPLADAILFLSLISGRNPEMLIGKHVIVAPYLKRTGLEIIPTGYILVDSGKPTTALYMSNSTPIPSDKDDIALCTAMAGEMLGLKMIYLDAGSGALNTVSESMVEKVKEGISVPLIVGGGIRTAQKAESLYRAGADIIIVGNAVESNHALIEQIARLR
jgi:phosphoglycerol geranylgeranyltransferase